MSLSLPASHVRVFSQDEAPASPGNFDDAPVDPANLAFVEQMAAEYRRDPSSIDLEWRRYFDRLESNGNATRPAPSFKPASMFHAPARPETAAPPAENDIAVLQDRVDQLVRAYRLRGHLAARIDPLGMPRPAQAELDPEWYGFTPADLERSFSTDTMSGHDMLPLGSIVWRLFNTYCRSIGVEFMHIDDSRETRWLQDRMEATENHIKLSRAEQLRILAKLTDAVVLEDFIQKRFLGAKSFSLEGAETLIPLLELAIEYAADMGVEEIILGMAHRGRLNVLANIMGKRPRDIFREFEDLDPELQIGRGDVKYHLGHSTDWTTQSGRNVHLSLCFNPSHLEFVNPVALGRTRAKQDRAGDDERRRGLPILIHGDAAFAGEGLVQETFNLSELEAYTTGGTVHIIVNNQIGFTTSPREGRSTRYATDVAKMLQIPIFHVNGEDPEAAAQAVRLALDFRREFQRDAVIDMYCYRRRGHNEGDEPSFTQPVLYRAIEQRKSVRDGYLEHLLALGGVTREDADRIAAERRQRLEDDLSLARSASYVRNTDGAGGVWSGYFGGPERLAPALDTRVPAERLAELMLGQTKTPAGFVAHPTLERLLKQRREMAAGERPLDWAAAEGLALASLAVDGVRVRLTGQDSGRGTFSQRHAVLHDSRTGESHCPLAHLSPRQAPVEIFNSPLSETAVLAFEYGYSLDTPDGLVMWEAQFGDFVNVAQPVIDQFIASAEDKWRRLSGLVMLLPHGFEGQGPEHSSARLERFLAIAAKDNLQVVNLSTPAQYYHLLRRQGLWKWRKPLVVMTPKSLLRHPQAVSSLDECASGRFLPVIPDDQIPPGECSKVLMCCGKIYYEILKRREELERRDVAIVRMEQLYPFPREALRQVLAPYRDGAPVLWVQEEPENMGAWRFVSSRFGDKMFSRLPLRGVSRPGAASPATGSLSSHKLEQQTILDNAFSIG